MPKRSQPWKKCPPQDAVKHLRVDLGLTQKEFAALIGRTPHTVSGLEQGRFELSRELAMEIGMKLNVAPQWLLQNNANTPIREIGDGEWDESSRAAARFGWSVARIGPAKQKLLHRLQRQRADVIAQHDLVQIGARLHAVLAAHYGDAVQTAKLEMRVDQFLSELEEEFGSDDATYQSHRAQVSASERKAKRELSRIEPELSKLRAQERAKVLKLLEKQKNWLGKSVGEWKASSPGHRYFSGEISIDEALRLG